MFAFMAAWPTWLIPAIVAGVMGAMAGAIGSVLGRRNGKVSVFLIVVAVAASKPVSDNFVLPVIENDIANAGLPMKVDTYTTMKRVEIDGKAVRYFFDLDESVSVLTSSELKTAIGIPACSHWRDQFKRGSYTSAQYVYDFKPSGRVDFTLLQADCP
ncbi:hypothetical protein IFT66_08485 [Rhizobium sp. CFBP 13726]|uniref:hypothetical protein n=1 Tax=Rhizobium sp. CFBP 13726 TaxID=2775296 RepID=UPI0017811E5C|nr:hypothetical protein [Rhizobium sp. CFBP 13726]MBD8651110.1 hypothetical protein [Rhizobium sp. CFBP 13726]